MEEQVPIVAATGRRDKPHEGPHHDGADGGASPWVRRFIGLVRPGGRILDLACGGGRHTRLALARGYGVLAVDRDIAGLGDLIGTAGLEIRALDWEVPGMSPPFQGSVFDGIIVTNYLYRPHLAALTAALAPGGILIYETFALGNARFGRPRNPDFLLAPDELLLMARPDLRIIAFEQGIIQGAHPAVIQRLAAARTDDWTPVPPPEHG